MQIEFKSKYFLPRNTCAIVKFCSSNKREREIIHKLNDRSGIPLIDLQVVNHNLAGQKAKKTIARVLRVYLLFGVKASSLSIIE